MYILIRPQIGLLATRPFFLTSMILTHRAQFNTYLIAFLNSHPRNFFFTIMLETAQSFAVICNDRLISMALRVILG